MYLLELMSDGMTVYQTVKDKDTLWLVTEAMLDGDMDVEIRISRRITGDVFDGKGEERK